MNQQIQNMMVGFIDAMLWANTCTPPNDSEHECFDDVEFPDGKSAAECLSVDAAMFIESVCQHWHNKAENDMDGAFTRWLDNAGHNPESPTDWQCAGRTLYMTISGAGCSFTDYDNSDNAQALADAYDDAGYFPSPYIGDDWLIYLA